MHTLKTELSKEYYVSDKDYIYIQEIRTILIMLEFNTDEVLMDTVPFPRYKIRVTNSEEDCVFYIEICFTDVKNDNSMRWSHLNIVKNARIVDSTMNKSTGLKYVNEYIQQYFEMGECRWQN